MSKQWSGNPNQTPVKFRASRQTTEESPRYSYGRQTTTRQQTGDDDTNDDAYTVPKPRTSAYRYDYPDISPRRSKQDRHNPKRTQLVRPRRPFVGRVLIFVGLGVMIVILGVVTIQALGNWWQLHTDDVTYGRPRTYQTDQYVGHGDSQAHPNHFIALNLNGTVEEIFRQAEAEIQPMLESYRRWRRKDVMYGLAEFLCFCLFLSSIAGTFWQCITYPHTLVILYTKAIPAHVTTTLDLATRTLAPITITRSATRVTTGTGHQDATRATGTVTFYNGSYVSQTINAGTVYTGSDGIQIALLQPVTIPAASPPQFGEVNVPAQAVKAGGRGNIAAYDITLALSNFLTVKNLTSFTGGRDARTYRAVAAKDIATLNATINGAVTQAFTTAFTLQPDQAAIPTNCTAKATPDHQTGEEAQTVTLTLSKTCLAIAYNQSQLTRAATAAFTETRPGAIYHIVGSLQTSLIGVTPLTVRLSGKWAFTFSQSYQDHLAEQIQGDDPAKARIYLLRTGIISYASIPNQLASADYINFLVLVG